MGGASQRSLSTRAGATEQSALAPSPLDPFLRQLLVWAANEPRGFSQAAAATAAETFEWQPAFADAVFTSARVRGLIEPYFGKGTRGRSLWQLSKRGLAWLETNSPAVESIPGAAQ